MTDLIIKMILEAIFASIASVGFAMVFNVPKHTLIYCAFGGAITFITRTILLDLGIGVELSTFIASTIIGIIKDSIRSIANYLKAQNEKK